VRTVLAALTCMFVVFRGARPGSSNRLASSTTCGCCTRPGRADVVRAGHAAATRLCGGGLAADFAAGKCWI